jgi:uncharacterized protein (TIGR00730 family)
MKEWKSIAVFCGSKPGLNPRFMEHTKIMGALLANKGITVVYGGGRNGMMGVLADAAMAQGGKVIGILPESLAATEHRNDDITELLIVDSMHSRKKLMFEKSDAAIVLPGGFGTMDELFEMLTWNQLNIHDKEIFFLNTDGFYHHLIGHIRQMHSEGMLYHHPDNKIRILEKPEDLLLHL